MRTALITGASAGLGREFAWQLAESGHDVVLVARDVERLEVLASQLSAATGVSATVLAADLADPEQLARVAERIRGGPPAAGRAAGEAGDQPGGAPRPGGQRKGGGQPKTGGAGEPPIDVVVLNAGYALGARFHRTEPGEEEKALAVMVTAVLVLTRAALDAMLPARRGTIITVGSVAGLMASGTYSAHKAWVRTFTEGLAQSLRGTGVTATVVNPGLTRTEFHERAGWSAPGAPGWAWLSAERVVSETLAAARAGKAEVTPSRRYRAASLALRAMPRGLVRRISRNF